MNIDNVIQRLKEQKEQSKNEIVRNNVQMKIDILLKKKRQHNGNS